MKKLDEQTTRAVETMCHMGLDADGLFRCCHDMLRLYTRYLSRISKL